MGGKAEKEAAPDTMPGANDSTCGYQLKRRGNSVAG